MVSWSGHCVADEVTQVRIPVWTGNILLNSFLEQEAHKQTKKNTDTSQVQKKVTEQKQYRYLFEKTYHVVEQMLSTAARKIRAKPNHFLASSFVPQRLVVRTLRCGLG